jgi:hypothetical protein
MGGKQRVWACAGYGWLVDYTIDHAFVLLAEGERPVLCLPPGLTFAESEREFGWAMADLYEQRYGWLALLRLTVQLAETAAMESEE